MLHVSSQAVSNWERGIAPPDLENIMRIADRLETSVDSLLHPQGDALFLGIDGGGTKTEFVLLSEDGHVLKQLVKRGCNPNDIGYTETLTLLSDGIAKILNGFQSVKAMFCGISGISTGNHAKRLYEDLKKRWPQTVIQVKNDTFLLFSLDESAGMAIISGTGSVVFVKNGDAPLRLGGWGYLFDQAGSAYDIGRDAVCEVLREEDRREPSSLLSNLLLEQWKTKTVWEHINVLYQEGKPYIAGLAAVVFEAYRKGCDKAANIIDKNAQA